MLFSDGSRFSDVRATCRNRNDKGSQRPKPKSEKQSPLPQSGDPACATRPSRFQSSDEAGDPQDKPTLTVGPSLHLDPHAVSPAPRSTPSPGTPAPPHSPAARYDASAIAGNACQHVLITFGMWNCG